MTNQLQVLWLVLAALLLAPCGASAAEPDPKTTAESKASDKATEKTAEQLATELKPSIVVITMQGRDGGQQGVGTGFIISRDGLIATNLHVIGEDRPVRVQTADGRNLEVTAVHASDRAMDLAVLQVKAKDLPALELGDATQVKEGQPVVAIGNPLGLKHSVVQGIISSTREIEGRRMLQLAIPVEPGNSGGPVVDQAGRVLGIMTMKSLVTSNLGFAVESNALQKLLDKPNPVPMDRWLTIGVLDSQRWKPLFGANWTQRGGRIFVDGPGNGFGGRALCLASAAPPELPYEVAVSVKFEDKTGAAGLVFHADGEDKHYGFYPSAGKLRLSRFDGPSVFDWKVLHDIPSEHYQEGKWNDLKVRVAADKLTCYLNGHEVFASTDTGLTQGQVGLAKFRETSAEFRRFRIGKELVDDKIDEQALAALRDQVAALPSLANIDAAQVESLAQNGEAAGAALRREAEALETRAKELRLIAADVRTSRVTNRLAETLKQTDEAGRFNLLRAALQLALLDDEELELEIYEEQVDRMAAEIEQRLPKDADEAAKLAALDKYLFEDNGFHGSRTEYYHKANSHLHRVIDDREGLPITLSLLYIELGRRLNLSIEGVGLPGHFVVRHVPAEGEPQLIDVFELGQKLSRDDAAKLVRDFAGTELTEAHLAPYSQREILVRMLRNLLGVAQQSEDREAMLRYVTAVLVLEPDSARDRGMRGVLCFETGRREAAASAMDWFFEHEPPGIDLDDIRRMQEFFRRGKP